MALIDATLCERDGTLWVCWADAEGEQWMALTEPAER